MPTLILTLALIGRASFLEFIDLIDPTEARYATIAQDMLELGNWVTPMIRMPEGLVPYLGKPPLHFWLTALSYSLFGFDEWVARLPSFLAATLILFVVFRFCRTFGDKFTAFGAALITLSSTMFFFLAGASVTDVTLTALITSGCAFAYLFISSKSSARHLIWAASFCCALAFLCKGPVALILVGLPIILFSFIAKDFSWMKRVPWISCLAIFVLVSAPWFIFSEIENPGFSKYFFWNENLARYLLRDYGDRYGSGHVEPFGMSWIMTFLAIMPWPPLVLWKAHKVGWKNCWTFIHTNKSLLFALCWGASAPLFFTFVRQLHAMYVLPAIPGLAIVSAAVLLRPLNISDSSRPFKSWKIYVLIAILWMLTVGIGLSQESNEGAIAIAILTMVSGGVFVSRLVKNGTELGIICTISAVFILTYLLVLTAFSPFINQSRSAEQILQELVNTSNSDKAHIHRVGVFADNRYSFYWTAGAWQTELGQKIEIKFIRSPDLAASDVCHVIVRVSSESDVPSDVTSAFVKVKQIGKWFLYRRKDVKLEGELRADTTVAP